MAFTLALRYQQCTDTTSHHFVRTMRVTQHVCTATTARVQQPRDRACHFHVPACATRPTTAATFTTTSKRHLSIRPLSFYPIQPRTLKTHVHHGALTFIGGKKTQASATTRIRQLTTPEQAQSATEALHITTAHGPTERQCKGETATAGDGTAS